MWDTLGLIWNLLIAIASIVIQIVGAVTIIRWWWRWLNKKQDTQEPEIQSQLTIAESAPQVPTPIIVEQNVLVNQESVVHFVAQGNIYERRKRAAEAKSKSKE